MEQDPLSKDIVQAHDEQVLVDPEIIEINIICRLCANPNERIIGIYSEEGISNDLANKMNLYLPVKVSENDALPLQCCWSCASTVLAWHELVVASVEADRRLRKLQLTPDNDKQTIDSDYEGIDDASPTSPAQDDDRYEAAKSNASVKDEENNCTSKNNKTHEEHLKAIAIPLKNDETNEVPMCEEVYVTCEICKMTFLKHSDLLSHIKQQHEKTKQQNITRKIVCNVCDKSFATKSYLKIHRQKKHQNLTSNVVKPKLEVKNELVDNITVPIEPSYVYKSLIEYPCDICDDVFKKKSQLTKHLKDHGKVTQRIRRSKHEIIAEHFCDVCGKGFTRKFDMQKHRKGKHPNHPKPEEEPTQREKNIQLLKRCKVPSEDNKSYYKCEICDRLFRQSYNFMRHQTVHTGVREFFCHICGKNFRVSGGLYRHISEHHYGIKKFECEICGKSFATKATRDDHKNIHTGERPFICDICGKAFRQKASLHIHKLFHTDNYRFSCTVCGKQYRRASELKIHSWLHTGHKPHECTVCGSRFRLRQDLKRHLKIHDKLNECVCNECGSAFSQERYLKNHKKAHRIKSNFSFAVLSVS